MSFLGGLSALQNICRCCGTHTSLTLKGAFRRCVLRCKSVAGAPDGFYEFFIGVFFKLVPHPLHVDRDG